MIQRLIDTIQEYVELNQQELLWLEESIDKRYLKKGEVFFSEGKISTEIYYVVQGCIRLFYNVNGDEKTAFFYTDGQFICAGESYTFGVPAVENYQAIEAAEIFVFEKKKTEELLNRVPKMEIIARVATENELITSQKIIASFVTQSAEQRYVHLLSKQGALLQRVPQQYIASYLGVSPETLSRIKARVARKGLS